MESVKFWLITVIAFGLSAGFFVLAWYDFVQGREGQRWHSAPATIDSVYITYADKFKQTRVRGRYQGGHSEHSFDALWGVRLPEEAIPQEGSTVTIWYDPEHPDEVAPARPEVSWWQVLKFGTLGLVMLGVAVATGWIALSHHQRRNP